MVLMGDAIFNFIEKLQGSAPWGTLLDAGTGPYSLDWIAGLATTSWTAASGDPAAARRLEKKLASRLRPVDRVVSGNWQDPLFLYEEVYEVVLADYLLGAVEGFAPFFQGHLFKRLRPHVGSRLYVVGLAPYPSTTDNPWGQVVLEISRLRDVCLRLSGGRSYREYPLDWTLASLERSGFSVEDVRVFPICYGARFVNEYLDVCHRSLRSIRDRALAAQLEHSIKSLRERALALHEVSRGTQFGEDYVVHARPV